MKEKILEVCVDSVSSAIAAQNGGASRIELCSNLIIGGTTPSIALFEEVKKNITIPVHVLIRPRFGDFCYDKWEYAIIKREVVMFRDAGAASVVIGCLTTDGMLDEERMAELVLLAKPMKVTLHRAFDVCCDPFETLALCYKLGINTILTSGQESSSLKGMNLIEKLCNKSKELSKKQSYLRKFNDNGERIEEKEVEIMAGAGINASVIQIFLDKTEITSFHMSGKEAVESNMTYRKDGVPMGLPGFSEFEIWRTSEDEVRKAVNVLYRE